MRDKATNERLYWRAFEILSGRANGHALPILRMLAARREAGALDLGDLAPRARMIEWQRRAALNGDGFARYNFAVDCCNRGDLAGYRHWLARAGDADSRAELKQFRTRFPQQVMRRYGRLRPERKDD